MAFIVFLNLGTFWLVEQDFCGKKRQFGCKLSEPIRRQVLVLSGKVPRNLVCGAVGTNLSPSKEEAV